MSYLFTKLQDALEERTAPYGKDALKFIVDAQLPKRLSELLNDKGFLFDTDS